MASSSFAIIIDRRRRNQGITSAERRRPEDVVAWHGAVQAQGLDVRHVPATCPPMTMACWKMLRRLTRKEHGALEDARERVLGFWETPAQRLQ